MTELYKELLVLPPVHDAGDDKPRKPREPDTSTLTVDQKTAYDCIVNFLSSDLEMYLLKGYAGTGKTYLTTMVLDYILTQTGKSVAVTAPTNKAVQVLRKTAMMKDASLAYMTVHSLLGLKETINFRGEQVFKKMREEDVKIHQYNIVILDEASMFADELFTEMLPYLHMFDIKLLFIGDPAQIPPVGGDRSMPFKESVQEQYGIETSMLSEIVRQSADNPIIKITMDIRNSLNRPIAIPVRNNTFDESMNGTVFLNSKDKDFFFRLMDTYFNSDNFKADADFAKVLAWTNRTVDTFNALIRKMIYGPMAAKVCIGEKMIANKPIINHALEFNKILFTTNEEFTVRSFTVEKGQYKKIDLTYYLCDVENNDGVLKEIKIIHEDSDEDFKLMLDYFKSEAISNKGNWKAADFWQKFYRAQEAFGDVKYNYAIACHKAQGSSYDNAIVLESDIDKNRKIEERNRIKYTACTRPRNRLFLIE